MTIIAVNAPGERVTKAVDLRGALDRLGLDQPVTLLTHGFRYCPFTPDADPHTRLFSTDRRKSSWKSVSWAHYLRLSKEGLGIGFGWPALGRLDQAATRAFAAGRAMAGLITEINAARPDLRVRVVVHSLGARVALEAMQHAPTGSVETLLLLSGAEYRPAAERAMASQAGQAARVINVTSGENLAFDTLFRVLAPGRSVLSPMLSSGLGRAHPRWMDLRIDNPAHLAGLRALGYRPADPTHRVCHWSSFIRPGLFPIYRDLLGESGAAAFSRVASALPAPRSTRQRPVATVLPGRRVA